MFGVENRSENWRLAKAFIDKKDNFLEYKIADIVLSNCNQKISGQLSYEFFWTGFRDYCHSVSIAKKNSALGFRVVDYYQKTFSNLLDNIHQYNITENNPKLKLNNPEINYVVNEETKNIFLNNLYYTEVDIIIRAGSNLLIGEVKSTQTFGSNSKHVLVHQLLRQYIMVSTLVNEKQFQEKHNCIFTIIPFVIANRNAERTAQVKIMKNLGWLVRGNVLNWDFIEAYK